MTLPLKIFDAHHHLWNPVSNEPDVGYVWLKKIGAPKPFGDPTPIQRDYLLEEFSAEYAADLVGSVHVQADGAIADPIAETAFIDSQNARASFPISIVGFVDLAAENAETTIGLHMKFPSVVGIRQILSRLDDNPQMSFAPEHYLENARWRKNFRLLSEHRLTFDAQLYPEQMNDAASFFSDHPDVPVIIDHAGSPHDAGPQGFAKWKAGMGKLAQLAHVSVKISGLGMFDLHLTGKRDARPYTEWLFENFGKDRVCFGSNFPVDKLMSTYNETIENITRAIPVGSEGDVWRNAIFHDNAKRFYSVKSS